MIPLAVLGLELCPALTLLIPLAGALLIALLGRHPNLREAATLSCAAGLFAAVLGLWSRHDPQAEAAPSVFSVAPGLELRLETHALGLLFAPIGSSLWILNSLYSIGYMRAHDEQRQTRFYACFALALASVMGIAFAGNGFTLFVFYESLTLSTLLLVAHHGTPAAVRSARLYLGILVSTSVGLLMIGLLGVQATAGSLDFGRGGVFQEALGSGEVRPWVVGALFVVCVFGIGKAALMPFHRWLPAAMVAPTPVSALLHAVAVVKAGVFCVLRLTTGLFGLESLRQVARETLLVDVVLYAACFTMIAASVVALRQTELKRMLAYSTIGQLSYIVVGASLLSESAVAGGALHMLMHAVGKITLFFCAGAIYVATHRTAIPQLRGIGHRMPITMGAFTLGSLSIIGLPPLGGTWSKWLLILGSMEADRMLVAAAFAVSTLLNIAYLIPIVMRAFLLPPDDPADRRVQEAPLLCVLPPALTAALCFVLFLFPDRLYGLVRDLGVTG